MKPKRRLGGAVYILPNLMTTGNLFFGFLSIVKGLQGDYLWAALAILVASIFDVLDGRVARLTGSTSEFGVQYDSLCDLISFGLAPAQLAFLIALQDFNRLGWIAAFLFVACGALRLARFNVQSSIGKASGDFTGLPIPMAAATIACCVLLWVDIRVEGSSSHTVFHTLKSYLPFSLERVSKIFLLLLVTSLALAMVSNLTYRSHKALKIKGVAPFKILVVAVAIIALISYEPEFFGFLFFFFYACSGLMEWLLGWKKPIDDSEIFEPSQDDTDDDGTVSPKLEGQ